MLSARKWFTGPVKQIAGKPIRLMSEDLLNQFLIAEEMGINVMEPANAEKFEALVKEESA